MMNRPKPVVLCILDGWGYRQEAEYNAIAAAKTPNWDHCFELGKKTFIRTSGLAVGLPDGQMGNSEVGHMNIGAGRVVYQELTRISKSIADGDFFQNSALLACIKKLKENNKALHVMGLLSEGGVHSVEEHIFAMIKMAAENGLKDIYLHAFLDGRDVPPRFAQSSLEKADALFAKLGSGRIATMVGRYYAMDRDKRWDRVEKAYDLLTQGQAEFEYKTAQEALVAAYARDENDEFVQASRIGAAVKMQDGDAIVFMNFRADRAREITYPFTDDAFEGFKPKYRPKLSNYFCLTQYQDSIKADIIFPPTELTHSFGEIVAGQGLSQLRIAETEKYPHVTFFFNGGREAIFAQEERIMVPSPKVATYDLQPEMSAPEVGDKMAAAIDSGKFDVIICNFANPDMVGHTGVFEAIVKAIEAVDDGIGKVMKAVEKAGGVLLITADHGNAELTWDVENNQPHTQHTIGAVPLVVLGQSKELNEGALCDLAPTMLEILGLKQPAEMTGKSLLK